MAQETIWVAVIHDAHEDQDVVVGGKTREGMMLSAAEWCREHWEICGLPRRKKELLLDDEECVKAFFDSGFETHCHMNIHEITVQA